MLTQVKMGKALNLSHVRVGQLAKEGMSMDSVAKAKAWRKARGNKRMPTTGSAANLQPKTAHDKRRLKARKPSNSGDSLLDALNNSIMVANSAFEDFEHARVNTLGTRSVRLSEHSKAIEQ